MKNNVADVISTLKPDTNKTIHNDNLPVTLSMFSNLSITIHQTCVYNCCRLYSDILLQTMIPYFTKS